MVEDFSFLFPKNTRYKVPFHTTHVLSFFFGAIHVVSSSNRLGWARGTPPCSWWTRKLERRGATVEREMVSGRFERQGRVCGEDEDVPRMAWGPLA